MKQLACILVAIVFSISVPAQDVKLGVKGGLTLAKIDFNLSGASIFTTESRSTFHGGFFATIRLSKKFDIQPELMYSGEGGSDSSANINLGYLNVPLMFRYNIVPWANIQAGPQLSILLSATDGPNDISSQFTSMDLGAAMGFGFDLPARINLSFRYIIGRTDISTLDYSSLGITNLLVTNRVMQFSIGYNLSGD